VYQAYAGFPAQEPQKSIRNMQVKAIVFSFGMMNSAYNPLDAMFLMGSQTKDWDLLFDRAKSIYCSSTSQLQIASLDKPRILRLDDPDIGIKGAVADFINKNR